MKIPDNISVAAARQIILAERRKPGGIYCPACMKITKEYRRHINPEMARSLILIAGRVEVGEKFHLRQLLHGMDPSKHTASLRWWDLLETSDRWERGCWALTEKGRLFAQGRAVVLKWVWEFDAVVLEREGPYVTIRTCLSDRFNFDALWHNT